MEVELPSLMVNGRSIQINAINTLSYEHYFDLKFVKDKIQNIW